MLQGKTTYDTIETIAVDPTNGNNVYAANHTEKIVAFSVAANVGAGREGTITMAGQTFTVRQRGF